MSTARMRLVLLDLEGSPDELQAVLRAALSAAPGTTVTHEAVNVALVEANGQRHALPVTPRRKPAPKPRPSAAVAEATDGDEGRGAVAQAVYHVLRNGPLSSAEAFEATKNIQPQTTAGSVYQVLRTLTQKGLVEKTIRGDGDGTTVWKRLAT